MDKDDYIKISHLTFSRNSHTIFDDISLNIKRGKITVIMGPSGSGKTTLLKLITAQLYPSRGQILIDGVDIHKLHRHDLFNLRKNFGYLFQTGALFTNLNVMENVAFPLREHTKLPEEMIRDLVLIQLEAVGLRGAYDLMPNELSGGMARRVALARALAFSPKLMLYDEPFTGQDPITMGVLLQLIKKLNDILGLTSIIVSHDVAEAASIADYLYVIAEGKIVGEGNPQAIFASKNPFINQFVHGYADGPVPFHYPAKSLVEDLMA